jgi:hypothetical protein
MSRRKPVVEEAPRHTRVLLRRWLGPFFLVLVLAGLLFAGLIWFDHLAREQIGDDQRYHVQFTQIECNPPPGLTHGEFLDEVQYYDGTPRSLPERFSLLDPDLETKLKTCFTRHPWVQDVTVELRRPHTVVAHVVYRQPIVVVALPGLPRRAVDRTGVLLPKRAPIPSETVALENAPRLDDPLVALAGRTMAEPEIEKLQIMRMVWQPDGLVLWGKGLKVLWGKGGDKEPQPAVKVQRIVQARDRGPGLLGWFGSVLEVDVRPADRAIVRVNAKP